MIICKFSRRAGPIWFLARLFSTVNAKYVGFASPQDIAKSGERAVTIYGRTRAVIFGTESGHIAIMRHFSRRVGHIRLFASLFSNADAKLVQFHSMQDIAHTPACSCRAAITHSFHFRQFKPVRWEFNVSFREDRANVHVWEAYFALYTLSFSN